MSYPKEYISVLTDIMKSGIKDTSVRTLGLEAEHIIVYRDTKEAVPFLGDKGVSYIINELSSFYPDCVMEKGEPLFSFYTDKFTITIEPAAQLEISISPRDEVASIEKIYDNFYENLNKVLTDLGYECLSIGYQPKSKVADLKMIPKKRYEYMDKYFKTSGNCGINMMRGTASSQISIDFYSHEDFRQKIQVGYYLIPYLRLIFDNCPYFEGEKNTSLLKRMDIWDDVDGARCGIIPGVFDSDFSFENYAEFILNAPPIFIPKDVTGSDDLYTGDTKVAEYLDGGKLTEELAWHLLSISFPDIRVKQYLEIRVCDSVEKDRLMALCALTKALFYNDNNLDSLWNEVRSKNIKENDIKSAETSLKNNGFSGEICGEAFRDFHNRIMEMAENALSLEESAYLTAIKSI